jgi:hypothetical protein
VEADTLKEIIMRTALAVVLGLALVLLPLFVLAETRPQNYAFPQSLSEKFREVERPPSDAQNASESDIQVFAACFTVALVAYIFTRRRRPQHEYRWFGQIPY